MLYILKPSQRLIGQRAGFGPPADENNCYNGNLTNYNKNYDDELTVSAAPMISLCSSMAAGIHAAWIGVGLVKPMSCNDCNTG